MKTSKVILPKLDSASLEVLKVWRANSGRELTSEEIGMELGKDPDEMEQIAYTLMTHGFLYWRQKLTCQNNAIVSQRIYGVNEDLLSCLKEVYGI